MERKRSRLDGNGIIRVAAEVAKYINENPKIDPESLVSNSDFQLDMERKCDAPQYFGGPDQFHSALERAVKELSGLRSGKSKT
jgi:hypothetical protein